MDLKMKTPLVFWFRSQKNSVTRRLPRAEREEYVPITLRVMMPPARQKTTVPRLVIVAVSLMVLAVTVVASADEKEKAIAEVQERVFSGPQPNETIKPFKVLVFTDQTEELLVANEAKNSTTLICFIHKLSNDDRILYGLGLVDFYARRYKSLKSHIVLLSDDRAKMKTMIKRWTGGPLFAKSQVSVSLDGAEGPGAYGLNRKVAMTVVVAKGNKVVDNFVFQAPNNNDLQTIMASVARAMGKPEPTLAKVQQELRAERQRQAEKRITASPVFKLASDEQLGRIMYGMVHARGNRSKNAERRSQQLLDWAGDDNDRKSALKKYVTAVLEGNFNPDRYAREALEELIED